VVYVDADAGTIRGRDTAGMAYLSAATAYTNTAPLYLLLAFDGSTTKGSAYFRQPGSTAWTTLFQNQSITLTAGTPNATMDVGKLGANSTICDILDIIPLGSASAGYAASLVVGQTASTLVPIRAVGNTGSPQRFPVGPVHRWYQGSPLNATDTYTATTVSKTPLSRLSPYRSLPSPTLQYVGASGSLGATYRLVYDLGASQETRISPQSFAIMWANMGPVDQFRGGRWDGSADVNEVTVAGYDKPFGADGAVGFARASAGAQVFTANGVNGTPQYINAADWVDRWVRVSDGTDTIIAKVARAWSGQFTNATGSLQFSFEIDRSTIVAEAGAFADLATSTTTGNIHIFSDDGVGIGGAETIDAARYFYIEWDLANGASVPKGGFLTLGSAYFLARTERDGSSVRWISPDDVRQMPGTGFIQGEKVRRRAQRVLELPYDSILVQPGYYSGAGSTINTLSITGNTAYAHVDNNLEVIRNIHDLVGQKTPVWVCPWVNFGGADPASTNKAVHGRDVMCAIMERQIDRTAARGVLKDHGSHAQAGGRLLVSELI